MRVIVTVGGIISGVGKGVATAAMGRILQEYGYSVTAVKIDPYINFDAGTLRPTEHGEVWVTDDGGEIDQDLGNYERFLGFSIPRKNNITTGQVYWKVIQNERKGKYLGQTVQFIPHIPNEIKRRIKKAGEGFDFVLVEIGGTIGDYENLPFVFAMKSLEIELGRENIAYVLVSYLPIPPNIGEMKTKPTQQAIKMMTETGIYPDFVLCRAEVPLDDERKKKIQTYANMPIENIISAPDVSSIYEVPLNLEREELGLKLLKKFGLMPKKLPDWHEWNMKVRNITEPKKWIDIAIVGKYLDSGNFLFRDSYISIFQAIDHSAAELGISPHIKWIDSKTLERSGFEKDLEKYQGIIIPGGFGSTGIEGKINAIKFARENNVPFLGLCLGMQLAVVEWARACGLEGANSTEINPNTKWPVIDVQPAQKILLEKSNYGGTMRLGAYAAILKQNSRVHEIYSQNGRMAKDQIMVSALILKEPFRIGMVSDGDKNRVILERHRHRYEVNPELIKEIEHGGFEFSGWHMRLDGMPLMEFVEIKNHKFFVGTQAHPEFKSRFGDPAPLFLEFLRAAGE